MKIKIKKNEILWVTISDENHIPRFAITSDRMRSTYFLYSINEKGDTTKIKQSQDPLKLNEYVDTKM
ncbi:protein of unknown function [Ruminococcaceae bacterium BL-6]|nr:protein of unknown function [Ruminococcaceae bacterium BL-6]